MHGAEAPVSQWVAAPAAGSADTIDATDWLPRIGPKPACMQTCTPISPAAGVHVEGCPGPAAGP